MNRLLKRWKWYRTLTWGACTASTPPLHWSHPQYIGRAWWLLRQHFSAALKMMTWGLERLGYMAHFQEASCSLLRLITSPMSLPSLGSHFWQFRLANSVNTCSPASCLNQRQIQMQLANSLFNSTCINPKPLPSKLSQAAPNLLQYNSK